MIAIKDKINPTHLHIAKNMALVGFFVVLAKFAGAAREVVIANEYGVAKLVDQYVIVSTFVLLLPAVWTSVAVSVLVPVSRKITNKQKLSFHSELTGVVCVFAIVLTIIVALFLPSFLLSLYPDATEQDVKYLNNFVLGLAPLVGGGLIIGLLNAQLLVVEKHANTLLDGIPALAVLLLVLVWPIHAQQAPLIIGSVIGVLLHIVILVWLLKRSSAAVKPVIKMNSKAWDGFKAAVGIMVLGKIVMSFIAPIEQYVAAGIGEGSIATLNYANKIIALLLGIGATAIGRAILPVFSDKQASEHDTKRLARQWSALLFVFGICLAALGWFLSYAAVGLLFERGAFTANDTNSVASVVQAGTYQLPFFFASIVLVQFFASSGRYTVLLVTSVTALVVKAISSVYLADRYGVDGIMLSTTLMYLVNCLILLVAMKTRVLSDA